MYGPLRPIPYEAMRTRLEDFSVIECGESDGEPGLVCRVFRQMKMGLGTGTYLNFPYDGGGEIIAEPELAGVLDYFSIDHKEFMDGCR